ncbi:TetR/AcrR family transcriptional regulator [Paraburkholderia sp. MM5384-R2]|uniref:TetR/AcrR family transcriptional regulator n=1 Tax=Paraburkholderia sp. MM5384-R2 TaxID=2723097 RepID=UPI001619B26E|nr:TetR/AcrR family transcriptional regulator [Paraburkholderia sp. MM5384-R2]MBB5498660.1 AcrR family transcriptional regulator [Paraburkholderia sp. MM5384-R2]
MLKNTNPIRRGRPARVVAEQLERHLLDVARRLFVTLGYEATTIDAVVVEAHTSKRTLYSRYANKEMLFAGVVIDHMTHSFAPVEAALTGNDFKVASDLRARLLIIARVYVEQATSPESQALDRIVTAQRGRFPELFDRLHREGYLRATTIVRELLVQAGAREAVIAAQAFYSLLVLAPMRENWGLADACAPDLQRVVDFVMSGAGFPADQVSDRVSIRQCELRNGSQ